MRPHLLTPALLALALIGGCASDPTPLAKAQPVPAERRFALPKPDAAQPARITFVMDTSSAARELLVTVKVDARRAAVLTSGEVVSFDVEPGERQVSADHQLNIGHHKPVVLENRLQPGQHVVYRIGLENEAGYLRLVMNRDVLAGQ